MLKILLVLPIFFVSLSFTGQRNPVRIYGTVMIDNDISMAATEVTVEEWMSFIVNNDFDSTLFPDPAAISASTRMAFEDLKNVNNYKYLQVVRRKNMEIWGVDRMEVKATNGIVDLTSGDTNYFSLKIPITGITFEQVKRFCKWKESLINSVSKRPVVISLPSTDIFSMVIDNRDSVCQKCDKCYEYRFNYASPGCPVEKNIRPFMVTKPKWVTSQGQSLLRVDSYSPTKAGLYNLQGNAGEMSSTQGVAMGGSFRHFAEQSYNKEQQSYSGPQDWLGFRYVVTLR